MSIRFTCGACRTTLKIGEMITAPRKVRCTGCGIVILVSPDPTDPLGVKTTIPQKTSKPYRPITLSRRQLGMIAALGVAMMALALIYWWAFTPPTDRGGVEGEVQLDGKPLEKGKITFEPTEEGKGAAVSADIINGRYRIAPRKGPLLGAYRVKVSSAKSTGREIHKPGGAPGEMIEEIIETVHESFNTKSDLLIQINVGVNTGNYQVTSATPPS